MIATSLAAHGARLCANKDGVVHPQCFFRHLFDPPAAGHEGLGKAYDNLGYYAKTSLLGGLRKKEKVARFSQSTSMPLLCAGQGPAAKWCYLK